VLRAYVVLEFASLDYPSKAIPHYSPFPSPIFSGAKQGLQTFFLRRRLSLEFEEVFCSKTRIKILKLLFKYGQLCTSDLARRIGANYETTLRHLTLLEEEGVVTQRLSGKIRFFRFDKTLKARTVLKLLEEWD
jgi:DNA-binding transcriptional ArsR family regulator